MKTETDFVVHPEFERMKLGLNYAPSVVTPFCDHTAEEYKCECAVVLSLNPNHSEEFCVQQQRATRMA